MQTHPPKTADPTGIQDLIQTDSLLKQICFKNKQLRLANAILTQSLAEPLRQNCFVSQITHNLVIITTKEAVWANQLRYQQSEILEILHREKELRFLQLMRVRVQPLSQDPVKPKPMRQVAMSAKTSSLLSESAATIKNDKLKQALLNLARNGST